MTVKCLVNGEVRQQGSTTDLLVSIGELIAYVSAFTTLLPGDVLLTGTPSGVGPIEHRDEVTVEIEGIGSITNTALNEEV